MTNCPKHGEKPGRLGDPNGCALCAREALTPVVEPTFKLVQGRPTPFGHVNAIKCLRCGRISHSLMDVLSRFCGICGYHPPVKE